jgi:hypothetical protein
MLKTVMFPAKPIARVIAPRVRTAGRRIRPLRARDMVFTSDETYEGFLRTVLRFR